MGLELRIPLGLMFLLLGIIMAGYGVLTMHDPMYARSLGENVNIGWGSIMCVFGLAMFLLGWRARSREPEHTARQPGAATEPPLSAPTTERH